MRVINTEAKPVNRVSTVRPIQLNRETYDWYSVDPVNASVYETYEEAIQDLMKAIDRFRCMQRKLVDDTQVAWQAAKDHAEETVSSPKLIRE